MNENRRNQRVNLLGSGWLSHNITKYSCRLVNISNSGALIILNNPPRDPLYSGNTCSLDILRADTNILYMTIDASIGRFDSGVAALEFVELSDEQLALLDNLMQKEFIFLDGGQALIEYVHEFAAEKGIYLESLCFDTGDMCLDVELHSLRLSAEGRFTEVHLHRDEIEAFHALKKIRLTETKIFDAFELLAEHGEPCTCPNKDQTMEDKINSVKNKLAVHSRPPDSTQ